MNFTSETSANGVLERLFSLEVDGDHVPGVIWSPADAAGSRPLLLIGHGGAQHKTVPNIVAVAHRYVTAFGFAVSAIDAPSHGERAPTPEALQFIDRLEQLVGEGKSIVPELALEMTRRAVKAVPEWRATLDQIQTLDVVGADRPVFYSGFSMGAAIGVPFVATDPRITAAVFGLIGLLPGNESLAKAAAQVTVPVEFVLQWEDQLVSHESGFALFDALGSKEKTLHANPGRHIEIPPHELESWERFFHRHL